MSSYRTLVVGKNGPVEKSRTFVCDNDTNAVIWAKQLLEQQPIDLWCGDRLVQRISPPSLLNTEDAISHTIFEGRMISKSGSG